MLAAEDLLHSLARAVVPVLVALLALLLASSADASDDPQPPPARAVVFLHGFASGPDIWRGSERMLEDADLVALPVAWRPERGADARTTATDVLLPAIEAALADAGLRGARFHVVAHSMSGLLVRYLLEHAAPELGARVESLVMISTPNQGARTGVAGFACALWGDPAWRPMGCELKPRAELIQLLGAGPPPDLPTRYLAIGVESFEPMVPIPPFDGDGDGVARGHDKAVMAESVYLPGVPFVVWRAWGRNGDHFGVTCSAEINRWAIEFQRSGTIPQPSRTRVRSESACSGLSKRQWRKTHQDRRSDPSARLR